MQPDRAAVDRHDVETYFRFRCEELKIIFSDGTDLSTLACIDGADRVAEPARRARFDLDETSVSPSRATISISPSGVRRFFALDVKAESYQVLGSRGFAVAADDMLPQRRSAFVDGSRSKSVSESRTRQN